MAYWLLKEYGHAAPTLVEEANSLGAAKNLFLSNIFKIYNLLCSFVFFDHFLYAIYITSWSTYLLTSCWSIYFIQIVGKSFQDKIKLFR